MKKKIVVADGRQAVYEELKAADSIHFDWSIVFDGMSCLNLIEAQHDVIDLLIVDWWLPIVHGVAILQKATTFKIPVILIGHPLFGQNSRIAISLGAVAVLETPLDLSYFFALLKAFFQAAPLPAPPAKTEEHSLIDPSYCYVPPARSKRYIKFWGTRGTTSVSGSDFEHFGGNTPCLEIRSEKSCILIDAGTGLQSFAEHYQNTPPEALHIVISHTHWDHIAGLPSFPFLYYPQCKVIIWTPMGFDRSVKTLLAEMLSYNFFPIRLDDLRSQIEFRSMSDGTSFHIDPFTINTCHAFHPSATLCFKIQTAESSFGYATDNEFLAGYHGHPLRVPPEAIARYQRQIDFFTGCHFLIHEAQFTPEEYRTRVRWGHSAMQNSAALMRLAKIPLWVLTHHDPAHTDAFLLEQEASIKRILKECDISCQVLSAFDGFSLSI